MKMRTLLYSLMMALSLLGLSGCILVPWHHSDNSGGGAPHGGHR